MADLQEKEFPRSSMACSRLRINLYVLAADSFCRFNLWVYLLIEQAMKQSTAKDS